MDKKTKRIHMKVKLQYVESINQYRINLPGWAVKKVLVAEKGDTLELDHRGDELIIRRKKK